MPVVLKIQTLLSFCLVLEGKTKQSTQTHANRAQKEKKRIKLKATQREREANNKIQMRIRHKSFLGNKLPTHPVDQSPVKRAQKTPDKAFLFFLSNRL